MNNPTQQEVDSKLEKEGVKYSLLSEAEKLEFYYFVTHIASKYKRQIGGGTKCLLQ